MVVMWGIVILLLFEEYHYGEFIDVVKCYDLVWIFCTIVFVYLVLDDVNNNVDIVFDFE